MEEKLKVVFTGALLPGTDAEACIAQFARRFHVDADKARELIQGGKEAVLKKGLDGAAAATYRKVLEGLGMEVRLEPEASRSATSGLALESRPEPPPAPPEPPRDNGAETCPKCGSTRLDRENDTCLDCGVILSKYRRIMAEREAPAAHGGADPYAAPRAELVEEAGPGEMTGPQGRPIGSGWGWLRDGFGYFKQNPLAWILAIVLWIALSLGLNFIPLLGGLAVNLLSPVIIAGFMLGCQEQEQGGDFQLSHLFAGFSNNVGQLVLLGVLLLVSSLAIAALMALVVGGSFFAMGGMEAMEAEDAALMMQDMPGTGTIVLMVLVVLGLSVPLMMAYYFAPVLVAIEGLSALSAMKHSFMGCLKNVLPFLWYGILATLMLWAGLLPLGLGLLVVLPTLTASMYASFRDIYYD